MGLYHFLMEEIQIRHFTSLNKLFCFIKISYKPLTQITLPMLSLLKSAKNAPFKVSWPTDVIVRWCSIFHWLQQKMCTQVTYSCGFAVDGFHVILTKLGRLSISESLWSCTSKTCQNFQQSTTLLVLKLLLKITTDFHRTTADHRYLSSKAKLKKNCFRERKIRAKSCNSSLHLHTRNG